MRATPRFDQRGDVALCKLEFTPTEHLFLSQLLGVQSSRWNKNTLEVERKLNGDIQRIYFHFVNNAASANALFTFLSRQPKCNNYILGYMSLMPSTFTLQISHTRSESIDLFDANKFGEVVSEFNFTHDIPTHWGMSGGAIIQINNKNEIRVFGVVRGGHNNIGNERSPEFTSLCSGSFLRKELSD